MTHQFDRRGSHWLMGESLPFMRCRCAKCKSRNKSGLIWERHPDGVWRKRNNNPKGGTNNE